MDYKYLKICLISDHAGFKLKETIKNYLSTNVIIETPMEIVDFGTYSEESCDYPDFAHELGKEISNIDKSIYGIAICGTGNGISMTVNKHPGTRCALCWNTEIAKLARQHNDANVLSIPARFITDDEAIDIVNTFFTTDFEGGRHQRRIDKINI